MSYQIVYHEKVISEDLPQLSAPIRDRVRKAIVGKLGSSPEVFAKPLHASAKGHRSLRVGNFRVVFRLENQYVKVLLIEHRSRVYEVLHKRLASRKK